MAREKGTGNLQRETGGRYTARICVGGIRISRSTRTKNYDKAEDYLQRMLRPFGRGDRRIPLAEAWLMYERSPYRRELAAATLKSKKNVWMHFAEWIEKNHIEITHLKQVEQPIIAEYLRVIRPGHSAGTYNNQICILREIYHVLAEEANLTDDPWRGVRLLADDVHTRREFTRDELLRIIAAATNAGDDWKLLFYIGMYTGLRLGDCCTLEWSAVNMERKIIQLLPRKTRRHMHGCVVTIPIHPELNSLLAARNSKENKYVIPMMAGWYLGKDHWRIGSGLKEIFKNAAIVTSVRLEGRATATADATFHSLRHTFVSFSANAGIPLPVVQSIVGHTSSSMTRHYYHENEEILRKAIESVPGIADLGKNDGDRHLYRENGDSHFGRDSHAGVCQNRTKDRLIEAEALLREGLVTTEEYKEMRARILAEI